MNLSSDLDSLCRLSNLTNCTHVQTNLVFEFGLEFCRAARARHALLAPVDGRVGSGADVEGVELVVVELVLVHWVLVTGLQNLSRLLSHFGFGAQLKQPSGERSRRFEVFQLEEQIASCSKGQNLKRANELRNNLQNIISFYLMHWLEIAMGEIGGHFTNSFLVLH